MSPQVAPEGGPQRAARLPGDPELATPTARAGQAAASAFDLSPGRYGSVLLASGRPAAASDVSQRSSGVGDAAAAAAAAADRSVRGGAEGSGPSRAGSSVAGSVHFADLLGRWEQLSAKLGHRRRSGSYISRQQVGVLCGSALVQGWRASLGSRIPKALSIQQFTAVARGGHGLVRLCIARPGPVLHASSPRR